jgi:hypothetical protein
VGPPGSPSPRRSGTAVVAAGLEKVRRHGDRPDTRLQERTYVVKLGPAGERDA